MTIRKTIVAAMALASAAIVGAQEMEFGLQPMNFQLPVLAAEEETTEPEISFCFDQGQGNYGIWGTSKTDTYDAAIRITAPGLVGAKITKIIVPVNAPNVADVSVWLSSELKLESIDGVKRNIPDAFADTLDNSEQGWHEIVLPEPYTITEKGVFVGNTFTVTGTTNLDKYPLVCAQERNADGLWIHTLKTYLGWQEANQTLIASFAIKAVITGGSLVDNAASAKVPELTYVPKSSVATVPVRVFNHGYAGVQSFAYECTLNGEKYEGNVVLDSPLPAYYGAYYDMNLEVNTPAAAGEYPLNFTIIKVNGEANGDVVTPNEGIVKVLNTYPMHRPLVECYTGLWCNLCPREAVGREMIKKSLPGQCVLLSFHTSDVLTNKDVLPVDVTEFPFATIDRAEYFDPYMGQQSNKVFAADAVVKRFAEILAPADIDVKAEWADDSHKVINVESTTTFSLDHDSHNYRIAYILVADSLCGEGDDWIQLNNYNKTSGWNSDLDFYKNSGSKISGLKFNDVPVKVSYSIGEENSLPAIIEADVPYSHHFTFTVAEAVNTDGNPMIQNKDNLRVVAYLVDSEERQVLNANEVHVPRLSGVTAVETDDADAPFVYYNLQGICLKQVSQPGFYIVRHGNKTEKVYVRQ
ncbi:MAG: hypothetical protein ACI4A8_03315 [Muribaculaceae bacterium]